MSTSVGVIQFPGTNCELDALHAFDVLGADTQLLWHGNASVDDVDVVIVPGGFAHATICVPARSPGSLQ